MTLSVTIDGTVHTSGTPNTRDYIAGSNGLERIITCDDSGSLINPMIVEGQIMGGLTEAYAMANMQFITFDAEGNCVGGGPTDCDDQNTCTTDSCDPVRGCVNDGLGNTDPCDDGDDCTSGDTCSGGVCQPGVGLCVTEAHCLAGIKREIQSRLVTTT